MARTARLSREQILRAALAIVDHEGLEAISMRRVGEALEVEAMSLYNHVANKAAMLDGIFEAVLSSLELRVRLGTWDATLRDRAIALREVLRAHPNVLPLFATRPAVTPAAIAYVEDVLDTLRSAGFGPTAALQSLHVLVAFVVGHTMATCSRLAPEDESRPQYDVLTDEFPRVREAARLLPEYDVEKEFEVGLDALLAGLALKLGKARR